METTITGILALSAGLLLGWMTRWLYAKYQLSSSSRKLNE